MLLYNETLMNFNYVSFVFIKKNILTLLIVWIVLNQRLAICVIPTGLPVSKKMHFSSVEKL